jgi:hypothetical protein
MAMLNWQGWAANFLGWGSAEPVVVPPPPSSLKPAGAPSRKPPRIVVEIDGKVYPVRSAQEAKALLAPKLAKAEAKVEAKKAPQRPVAVPKVEVRGAEPMGDVMALVDRFKALQAESERIYREWVEADEDDVEVLLLL